MQLRQIALDTETTGLEASKGHRIIEIGCIEMIDRQLTGNHFHIYINPERDIDAGAQQIHGISRQFLADKPIFSEIITDFKNFIDGAQLIIHNAPFDVGFLNHEFKLYDKKMQTLDRYCSIIDTLDMGRKLHPGQKNSLDALCKRYGVDNSHRELHGALVDADLLARMYLAMTGGQTELFSGSGMSSKNELMLTNMTNQLLENHRQFKVISASEAEKVLHLDRIQKIAAKAKSPNLWEHFD